MAGLTYNQYVTQLAQLAVVPLTNPVTNPVTTQDPNFNAIIPATIDYAELRIQRDLDLLSTVTSNVTLGVPIVTTANQSTISFTQGTFVTVQNVNVITPEGTVVPDNGYRNAAIPVSKEYLQFAWPSNSNANVPEYFAMIDDRTISLGPWPDKVYSVEIVGTARMKSLGPTDTSTQATSNFISLYLPDLLLMASMIYISGYQRNFGRLNDDPQMAQTYESQYQALLKGSTVEEYRKKFAASAWTSTSTSPIATPGRG
jgi:hypothetical protein